MVLLLADMYILSISVAVACVMRIGLVIVGINPLLKKTLSSSVFW